MEDIEPLIRIGCEENKRRVPQREENDKSEIGNGDPEMLSAMKRLCRQGHYHPKRFARSFSVIQSRLTNEMLRQVAKYPRNTKA